MGFILITHPAATIARCIENICFKTRDSKNWAEKVCLATLNRLIGLTAFPAALSTELLCNRMPKLASAAWNQDNEKYESRFDKITKYVLGILFSPLAIRSPDAISDFFLKRFKQNEVRPFGVENLYGRIVDGIHYPKTVKELQKIVFDAKQTKKQISIVGAGMSQGLQTVPASDQHIVINMKHLNQIEIDLNGKSVTVGAGCNWENLQIALNKQGKSVIVKQASDIFSIGGSIGINCHGWAHEYGAIASTVESLDVIDAEGNLRTLFPQDELFRCMFGTLGYFGIVVNAKLKVVENVHLIEKTEEISIDDFHKNYQEKIKGKGFPLFGGRLILDGLEDDPLSKVFMVRYEKDPEKAGSTVTQNFSKESKYGTRFQRIGLQMLSKFFNYTAQNLISWFWNQEKEAMLKGRKLTRNEALHPPINAFKMFHHSNLHTQWLQEYFIKPEHLPNFLRFLGAELKANSIHLLNATIRPTPKDEISILPYAEQDRYAVVISFSQMKDTKSIQAAQKWMKNVDNFIRSQGDVYYQAYMPFTTQQEFEVVYGKERVENLRRLKQKYDPDHLFGNGHTAKYFDGA